MCTYIGLDVGKADIQYHYLREGKAFIGKFANTQQAIAAFIDQLSPDAQRLWKLRAYTISLCVLLYRRQTL